MGTFEVPIKMKTLENMRNSRVGKMLKISQICTVFTKTVCKLNAGTIFSISPKRLVIIVIATSHFTNTQENVLLALNYERTFRL